MSREKKKDKEFDLKEFKKDKDGKYILPLSSPVIFGDETIKEIVMDEPKAKHIRNLPGNPIVDDILKICADLANQPDSFIDLLSLKDTSMMTDFFEAFN